MNEGLQYIVSLQAAQFTQGLSQLQSGTASAAAGIRNRLLAAGVSAAAGMAGLRNALDLGGTLKDLSTSTGESVSDLVVMRRAFTDAGLGAESVAPSLLMLQRALGGVNADGEPTAKVFTRIGLSIDALRQMRGADQLEQISRALARLPTQSEQAKAAMEMFGRSGGRMLQVLRDPTAFTAARAQLGQFPAYLQRNADRFDNLSDKLGHFRESMQMAFAGAAEKFLPTIDRIATGMDKIDWTKFGQNFADPVSKLAAALADVAANATKAAGGAGNVGTALGVGMDVWLASKGYKAASKFMAFLSGGGAKDVGTGGFAPKAAGLRVLPGIGWAIAAGLGIKMGIDTVSDTSGLQGENNARAEQLANLRKRILSAGSGDNSALEAEIRAWKSDLNNKAYEGLTGTGMYGMQQYQSANSDLEALSGLEASLPDIIKRNDAQSARDKAAATEQKRLEDARTAAARIGKAYGATATTGFERQANESDAALDVRRLALARQKVAAAAAELERARGLANAMKATADDAARAEEAMAAFQKYSATVEELQTKIANASKAKNAEEVHSPSGSAPSRMFDSLARVGIFVGGAAADMGRRQSVAAERTVHLLGQIERHLANPRKPVFA